MSLAKLDSEAVELAISAAHDALANDTDLAWIMKSCLIERAYFLGLCKGLAAIAEEDAIGKHHLLRTLVSTYWSRSADDTFPSTRLGRGFAALQEGLRGLDVGKPLDQQVIEAVIRDIDLLDREWRGRVEHARKLLADTQSAASGFRPPINEDAPEQKRAAEELSQMHSFVSELGVMVRHIALLETDHEMSKRIENA
ncbi:MAG: hypothetical protein WCS09_16240 [Pseudomonadota bacterium]